MCVYTVAHTAPITLLDSMVARVTVEEHGGRMSPTLKEGNSFTRGRPEISAEVWKQTNVQS